MPGAHVYQGSDPCRWRRGSGITCDGGQTVTAVNIDCTVWGVKLGGILSPMLAEYSSVNML